MRLLAIGVACTVLAAHAQDLPEWVRQLSRIKHQAKDNFQQIPNYVCRETVARYKKGLKDRFFVREDTLQFDVATVDKQEMIALPGASRFEDVNLSNLAPIGLIGTGAFSSLAENIFVNDVARITPHPGENALLPVPARYDFEIPAFLGGWLVTSPHGKANVGASGSFWADEQSLDLMRIEVHATGLPMVLGLSRVDETIVYSRLRIASSSVVLPQSAEMVATDLVGAVRRNGIEFSACREYTSESTIRFGEPLTPPPVKKK
ncbi:MAG TPA: hypothetical protein VLY04_16780 [Bryobacteraceae bacterium]|nr:hypothetical protein [Bryobacteraceae bacterium]